MVLNDGLQFCKLNRFEIETVVSWAAEEGWNPGMNDAEVFWYTDPNGYYGVKKDNELVGSGSIVSYNGDYGFMGFFIMKPEHRSQGVGTELWQLRKERLQQRLKKGATIGMDGVVEMQDFYAKGGFKLAYRDVRMEMKGEEYTISPNIRDLHERDVSEVLLYDARCFGFPRERFTLNWISQEHAKCYMYSKDHALQGYAVIRKAVKGYKIGPLFADNIVAAEELLKACLTHAEGDQVFLDIPMKNEEALKLSKLYNMAECFECGRMYLGEEPDIPIEKIFGVTTFELG